LGHILITLNQAPDRLVVRFRSSNHIAQAVGKGVLLRTPRRIARRAHRARLWWARGACHRAGRRTDPLALPTLPRWSVSWNRPTRQARPRQHTEWMAYLCQGI